MTVIGAAMLITWAIALRVVDRRRALFALAMLALYPIFNFKGYKYNPDLLQLPTLALLVLAYLNAFEKRTAWSGLWLGLAAALAMLTKYWALTMIGAIGIAALAHPDRLLFLRSKAPWVAMAAALVALSPHLVWLVQVHFEPLTFAGDSYANPSRAASLRQAIDYLGHNLALLALPAVLALAVLLWPPGWRGWFGRRGAVPTSAMSQAINIWIIQLVVLIGPVLGGTAFSVTMKTDWGIPLFFLVPLALVAVPRLRVQRIAVVRIVAMWLLINLIVLGVSPWITAYNLPKEANGFTGYSPRSELARQLTQIWRARFNTPWRVVVGTVELGTPMTFYSGDHPAPLTPWEDWTAGLTSIEEARRSGFIGVCDPTDGRAPICEAWMAANAPDAERLTVPTQRLFRGTEVSNIAWKVYIVPPPR
jgi:4-amino-4-deoxy-L-arabinose transferase-like glycosyltransferase